MKTEPKEFVIQNETFGFILLQNNRMSYEFSNHKYVFVTI